MSVRTPSLFDSNQTWLTTPQEALVAWLLAPDFVTTKTGEQQPLRASSVVVYRARSARRRRPRRSLAQQLLLFEVVPTG